MYAVVHLPDFPLQAALRHVPELWDQPVVLVDPESTTPRVIMATPAARAQGIPDGATPPQVLARCREAQIRHRARHQEAAAMDALVQVAFGFSPHVEATGPGMLTLDLRGLAEFSDPARYPVWAQRLRDAVTGLGFRTRVGVGATPNLARHAAVWSEDVRVVGVASEFVAGLPVAALEPSPHVTDLLQQWGIRTVGEFLALGQAELSERLGLEALALVAAASVSSVRPLHLVRPPERFEEFWEFEHEIETLEPLLFLLRRFVEGFSQRLGALGLAAEHLQLRLRLESGDPLEWRMRLPEPTRQADALFRTLQTHLESVRTASPVVGVALAAEPARPRQRQFSLFEAAVRDPHQFQETLARLSALVGADRVGTPLRENSHRPDAFRLVPPDFENAPAPTRPTPALLASTPVRRLRPARPARVEIRIVAPKHTPVSTDTAAHRRERPSPMLSSEQIAAILSPVFRPEPASSPATPPAPAVPGGSPGSADPAASLLERPVTVSSAVASGRVRSTQGPWKGSGQWWEPTSWSREEWEVELERGETLRLVQQGGSWTVEAVLD
jgi:protein ImuB